MDGLWVENPILQWIRGYPHFRKPPYMKHIIYDRSAHMFFHPNRMAGPARSYTMELVVTT